MFVTCCASRSGSLANSNANSLVNNDAVLSCEHQSFRNIWICSVPLKGTNGLPAAASPRGPQMQSPKPPEPDPVERMPSNHCTRITNHKLITQRTRTFVGMYQKYMQAKCLPALIPVPSRCCPKRSLLELRCLELKPATGHGAQGSHLSVGRASRARSNRDRSTSCHLTKSP